MTSPRPPTWKNTSSDATSAATKELGKNAIVQAYTIASNFPDAQLVMDDREDKLVDIILGATFKDLEETDQLPKTGSEIPNVEGCKPADQLTNVSKAPEHTPVG